MNATTDNVPHEKIIDRIRKLRALAHSDNLNEAQAAAAAASRLIAQYDIAEATISAAVDAPAEDPPVHDTSGLQWKGSAASWQLRLAAGLSAHHHCACVIARQRQHNVFSGKDVRVSTLELFGRKSDVEIVTYLYAWLSTEIQRLASKQAGRGRGFINSFRNGAAVGVLEAMSTARRQERVKAEEAGQSAAIVKVDGYMEQATAARAAVYPKLGRGSSFRSGSDYGGFSAGREEGRKIQHRSAIGSGSSGRLLGGG